MTELFCSKGTTKARIFHLLCQKNVFRLSQNSSFFLKEKTAPAYAPPNVACVYHWAGAAGKHLRQKGRQFCTHEVAPPCTTPRKLSPVPACRVFKLSPSIAICCLPGDHFPGRAGLWKKSGVAQTGPNTSSVQLCYGQLEESSACSAPSRGDPFLVSQSLWLFWLEPPSAGGNQVVLCPPHLFSWRGVYIFSKSFRQKIGGVPPPAFFLMHFQPVV